MTNLSILNEKQKDAVISECKRLLVLAGAGSGKTKTLIQKVLHLITSGLINQKRCQAELVEALYL